MRTRKSSHFWTSLRSPPGHTLVVPKKHARNLLEMDETATAQLFARVSKVAKKVEAATQAKGMNIISNMEEVSGQTVFHTHATLSLAIPIKMSLPFHLLNTSLILNN